MPQDPDYAVDDAVPMKPRRNVAAAPVRCQKCQRKLRSVRRFHKACSTWDGQLGLAVRKVLATP